jgi:poly(A) polymerase
MMNRIGPRPWMTAPATRSVIAALQAVGGPDAARFVGGCVRDALLQRDRPDIDIDIATPLVPEAVVQALEAAGVRAVPTGIEHGTITAVANGRPVEITTLRRDLDTDGRHAVVAFTTDWAEDAARRDFRMNTLYADPDGTLHDPTGCGVEDALAGRVVFVGDPATRITEDYLRVLRFFRFFAHYGRGPADTAALAACAELRAGLAGLSAERVSKELLKLLAAPDPRPALQLMRQTGVLAQVLPEARAPARFEGLVGLGPDGADPELRLAALLDDHSPAEVARRLRLPNSLRDRLVAAAAAGPALSADMPEAELRRTIWRLGTRATADRLRLAWATAAASTAPSDPRWQHCVATADQWVPPDFPITGDDVIGTGAAPGPEVGRRLRALQAWWLDEDFRPDRAALLARLRALAG